MQRCVAETAGNGAAGTSNGWNVGMNLDELKQWSGKTETLADRVTTTSLKALAATLDRENPAPQLGDAIPPCWRWLYFLPLHRHSEIGPDGRARRAGHRLDGHVGPTRAADVDLRRLP
jgi:hydroxyacyl-ACP dehydratase HTD2-like protein with hotdog domain